LRDIIASLTELWRHNRRSDRDSLIHLLYVIVPVTGVADICCLGSWVIRNCPEMIRRSESRYLVTSLDHIWSDELQAIQKTDK
jgi:hypothetical protein